MPSESALCSFKKETYCLYLNAKDTFCLLPNFKYFTLFDSLSSHSYKLFLSGSQSGLLLIPILVHNLLWFHYNHSFTNKTSKSFSFIAFLFVIGPLADKITYHFPPVSVNTTYLFSQFQASVLCHQ